MAFNRRVEPHPQRQAAALQRRPEATVRRCSEIDSRSDLQLTLLPSFSQEQEPPPKRVQQPVVIPHTKKSIAAALKAQGRYEGPPVAFGQRVPPARQPPSKAPAPAPALAPVPAPAPLPSLDMPSFGGGQVQTWLLESESPALGSIGRPTASRQASTAAPVVPWQPPHLHRSLTGSCGGPQRLGHGLGRRPGRGAHPPPGHILSPSNSFCIEILPRLLALLHGPLTVHAQALSLSFRHLFRCLPFEVHVIFTPALFCADNPAASFVNLVVPAVAMSQRTQPSTYLDQRSSS